jgi:hypothetical protein
MIDAVATRDAPAEHRRIGAEVRRMADRFPVPGITRA